MNVLFVCVQNAGRSQMAEALFARAAAGAHTARSAGSPPAAHVHPDVAEVLRELESRPLAGFEQLLTELDGKEASP